MAKSIETSVVKSKKLFSPGRLFLYALALIGLVWICIWGYWAFFKLQLWLAGFGTGIFWAAGLIAGFIYFYMAHKLHVEVAALPSGAKKVLVYAGFGLGVAIINPFPLTLAAWLFTPPGSLHTASLWFFVGCSIGGGIVLILERLFMKKKPKSDAK